MIQKINISYLDNQHNKNMKVKNGAILLLYRPQKHFKSMTTNIEIYVHSNIFPKIKILRKFYYFL